MRADETRTPSRPRSPRPRRARSTRTASKTPIFMSERLRAVRDADAHALLHARCLYAAGRPRAVTAVLGARLTSERARYLFARASYDCGELDEAERALRGEADDDGFAGAYGARRRPSAREDEAIARGGAAGEYLLGMICRDTGRRAAAIARFARALTADPLMWCAYEGLCALGADAEAKACASASREESILAMYPSLESNEVAFEARTSSGETFAPRTGRIAAAVADAVARSRTRRGAREHAGARARARRGRSAEHGRERANARGRGMGRRGTANARRRRRRLSRRRRGFHGRRLRDALAELCRRRSSAASKGDRRTRAADHGRSAHGTTERVATAERSRHGRAGVHGGSRAVRRGAAKIHGRRKT